MATAKLNGNHKFNGAIQTLTDAATQKKTQIQRLVEEKCADLKDTMNQAAQKGTRAVREFGRKAEQTIYEGTEQVKDAAITVDRNVRKNPWAYIGGATIAALVLGFALGKTKKSNK